MVWYGMVWYGMVWYGMVWYWLDSSNRATLLDLASNVGALNSALIDYIQYLVDGDEPTSSAKHVILAV